MEVKSWRILQTFQAKALCIDWDVLIAGVVIVFFDLEVFILRPRYKYKYIYICRCSAGEAPCFVVVPAVSLQAFH